MKQRFALVSAGGETAQNRVAELEVLVHYMEEKLLGTWDLLSL
jgi:hypothetical protein